jgi:hypothetical protein
VSQWRKPHFATPLPAQSSRLSEATIGREFELRARAALALQEQHRNAVRPYTSPDARRGFEQEALLVLGLPADTPIRQLEVRSVVRSAVTACIAAVTAYNCLGRYKHGMPPAPPLVNVSNSTPLDFLS